MKKFIEELEKQLAFPLPGLEAQMKMATFRKTDKAEDFLPPKTFKKAAVLCLLYPKGANWHIALMKRTTHEHDKHSGQVSFPGGRYEETDADYGYTALRETEEELGIPMKDITLIGKLTDIYIAPSNFMVYPYVGFCETVPNFKPDRSEVAEILEPSITHLLDPATIKTGDFNSPNGWTASNIRYFDVNGEVVWGATSMLLNEFLEVVRKFS